MNLKLALHVPFYVKPQNDDYNKKRLSYANIIIKNANEYEIKTDLFFHCNINLDLEYFEPFFNGKLNILHHDIKGCNTMILTRKPRPLLLEQLNEYDYFAYIEDDISFTKESLSYWLKYKDECIKENYNLGFCRYDKHKDDFFFTDIFKKLEKTVVINNTTYVINDVNPYCALWIYDKQEFTKFIKDPTFNNLDLMKHYGYPEKSSIGYTILGKYKNTVIPLIDGKLNPDSKIHHLPNNYINHKFWCKIKFDDALNII